MISCAFNITIKHRHDLWNILKHLTAHRELITANASLKVIVPENQKNRFQKCQNLLPVLSKKNRLIEMQESPTPLRSGKGHGDSPRFFEKIRSSKWLPIELLSRALGSWRRKDTEISSKTRSRSLSDPRSAESPLWQVLSHGAAVWKGTWAANRMRPSAVRRAQKSGNFWKVQINPYLSASASNCRQTWDPKMS